MLRIIFVLSLLATVFCADHSIYKNCSQVHFCSDFRTTSPDDDHTYKANIDSLSINNGIAQINLTNFNNTLLLKISALNDDKFRVIIEEDDSDRYHLTDVLDGEPIVERISYFNKEGNRLTIAEDENSISKVVIQSEPFIIEFYHNDLLESVLDGTRLYMENDSASTAFSIKVDFPNALQLYGIPEHKDNFHLQNTGPTGIDPYRLRNLDVSEHEIYSPMAIYASVPVLYAHGNNATTGVFLHNAAEIWVETNSNNNGTWAFFMCETGVLDLFILNGPRPKDVVRQYTNLTGLPHLPSLWALGYHQSRWNYFSQEEVKDVAANFDSHDMPIDSVWLDIDYSDGRKYFVWNDKFSDPVEMQQNLSYYERKLVVIVDPHIKVDDNYYVYKGGKNADVFIKNSKNETFEGDCWPGKSSYIDFLNPKGIEYYASLYAYDKFQGSTETIAGIWNDMNEPTVFDTTLERTLPGDALHYGGIQHKYVHNIYGMLHTKSTHLGLMQRDNGTRRPFVLTRSHFAGSQRYAGMWTGDNRSNMEDIPIGFAECLNSNMVGFAICGSDVGGFYANPTTEVLQRFYQANAWLPFYRAHANGDTEHREPYLFSEEVQTVIRRALKLRYKHLPVWYTLFYEQTRTSEPVIRPLIYHYPTDPNIVKIDDQILVGSDILVRSIYEVNATNADVYIPGDKENWYRIDNNEKNVFTGPGIQTVKVDINSIPVFYRAGSIIPRKETEKPSSTLMIPDCYTIFVNLDANETAEGRLYVDDYESFNYLNNKEYIYVKFSWSNDTQLEIELIDEDSNSDLFDISVCEVVVNKLSDSNQSYKQTVYNSLGDGTELSTAKVNSNKKTIFKF